MGCSRGSKKQLWEVLILRLRRAESRGQGRLFARREPRSGLASAQVPSTQAAGRRQRCSCITSMAPSLCKSAALMRPALQQRHTSAPGQPVLTCAAGRQPTPFGTATRLCVPHPTRTACTGCCAPGFCNASHHSLSERMHLECAGRCTADINKAHDAWQRPEESQVGLPGARTLHRVFMTSMTTSMYTLGM